MGSFLMLLTITIQSFATAKQYSVLDYGAKADGESNSAGAFLAAWFDACYSHAPAIMYVPRGMFLIRKAVFEGPCNNNAILILVEGTLVAPTFQRSKTTGYDDGNWLVFQRVDGVKVTGGTLDGKGASLWSCKATEDYCPIGATTLFVSNSKNIEIKGLTSRDSQMFHIVFSGCRNVLMDGVNIFAPSSSPNTDGIHVQFSSSVKIWNSSIRTGDDCISLGPDTRNLRIENVACGPGHGISIGSLGWELEEAGVENVTVKRVTFTGTQNGVRIKSWGRASKGYAKNIVFEDATMHNVHNPIFIDQNYCPGSIDCPGQESGIKISNVTYRQIHGTSASKVAVRFDCSYKAPCTGIRLEDVKLTYMDQPAFASCSNAVGSASGFEQQSACL